VESLQGAAAPLTAFDLAGRILEDFDERVIVGKTVERAAKLGNQPSENVREMWTQWLPPVIN